MKDLIRSLYLIMITLSGLNAQPEMTLWITPDSYHQNHNHYNMVPYPCDTSYYIFYHSGIDTLFIAVKNEGEETLTLQDIVTKEIPGASFRASGSYPVEIMPADMHLIKIIYQLPGAYHRGINGGLTLYSNDPDGPCRLDFEVGCTPEWKVRDQDLFGISTMTPCSDVVVFSGLQGVLNDAEPGIPRFVGSDSLFFYVYSPSENTSHLTMQLYRDALYGGVYIPEVLGVGRNPDKSVALLVLPSTDPQDDLGQVRMHANAEIDGFLVVRGSGVKIDSSLFVDGELQVLGTFIESDERLKTRLKPLSRALHTLTMLRPYTYFWNDPSRTQEIQYGFSAQQIEQVLPELVRVNHANNKSVNYTQLIPLLTAALQEQQKAIKKLEKTVEQLQKKIH